MPSLYMSDMMRCEIGEQVSADIGQCVILCVSLRWHLIVMNFKAGSRSSDSLGEFMKTVGGISVLYVCAGPHWITEWDQKALGLKGSVFSLCSQCGVCFYVCVIKAVVMKLHPLSARQYSPSYCEHSVRKKQQPWY